MFFEKPKITPLSQEFGSMVRGFIFFAASFRFGYRNPLIVDPLSKEAWLGACLLNPFLLRGNFRILSRKPGFRRLVRQCLQGCLKPTRPTQVLRLPAVFRSPDVEICSD